MTNKKKFGILWIILLAGPVIYELWAVLNSIPDDTLSESVIPWIMTQHPIIWMVTLGIYIAFVAWLGWHWWDQYRNDYQHPKRG